MARPGITYHEVANAAQELHSQGINPTVEAVRQVTGTGSNGTIAFHLRAWKAKLDETQSLVLKENLPEELVATMKGLWLRVVGEADEQIEKIRTEVKDEVASLHEAVNHAQQENTQLQQRNQKLNDENQSLIHDKVGLEQAVIDLQKQTALQEAKQEALEDQLEEKQTRINELNKLNQQTQANLEHYRESAREQRLLDQERHESEMHQCQATMRELKQTQQELKQQCQTLLGQYEGLRSENAEVKSNLQGVKNEFEKSSNQVVQLEQALMRVTQNYEAEKVANEKSKVSLRETEKSLQQLQAVYEGLAKDNQVNQDKLSKLTEANQLLAHEKWEAVQLRAQLEGQVQQLQLILKEKLK